MRWIHPYIFQRANAILLLAAIGGCDEASQVLVHVKSEKEANRILVALGEAGITGASVASKLAQRQEMWLITLPAEPTERVLAARRVLVQFDLPRESQPGYESLIQGASMIPSEADERARLLFAMSGELSRTFETYDRVTDARVHIVLPERRLLGDSTPRQPSAAILIKYVPRAKTTTATQPQRAASLMATEAQSDRVGGLEPPDAPIPLDDILDMVARSVEGLDRGNIKVTYTTVGMAHSAAPPEATTSDETVRSLRSELARLESNRSVFVVLVCVLAGVGLIMAVVLSVFWWKVRSAVAGQAAAV